MMPAASLSLRLFSFLCFTLLFAHPTLAVDCPPGQYSIDGVNCVNCTADSYCQDGLITSCPLYSTSPSGSSIIDECTCATNLMMVDDVCICMTGFLMNTPGVCTACPANYWCQDENTMTACADNALSLPGQSTPQGCNACPNGYVQTSPTNSPISCQVCTPGFACPNVTTEYPCPAGTYGPALATACVQCAANTYAPMASPSCYACDPQATAPAGSTSISACICNNGYYLNTRSNQCVQCPAGESCLNGASNNRPTLCSPGTFSAAGASTCTACPLGTYQDSSMASRCYDCPAGTMILETLTAVDPYLSANSVFLRNNWPSTTATNPLYISLNPITAGVGYNVTDWTYYAGPTCTVTPMLFTGTQQSAITPIQFEFIMQGTTRTTSGQGVKNFAFSDTGETYLVPPQTRITMTTPSHATYFGWQFTGSPCIPFDTPGSDSKPGVDQSMFYYVSQAMDSTLTHPISGATLPFLESQTVYAPYQSAANNFLWSVVVTTTQTLKRASTASTGTASIMGCNCPDGTRQLSNGQCQETCPDGQYIANPVQQACVPCAQGNYCVNSIISACPANMGSLPGATACLPCVNPGASTDIQLFTCGLLPKCSGSATTDCCTWNTPIPIGASGWLGLGTILVGQGSINGTLATPWAAGDTILGLQLNPASDRPFAMIQNYIDIGSLGLIGTEIAVQLYYRCTAANKCPDWMVVSFSTDGTLFDVLMNVTDFSTSASAWVQTSSSYFTVTSTSSIVLRIATQMAVSSSNLWIGNVQLVDLGKWQYNTIQSLRLLNGGTVLVPWFPDTNAWKEPISATYMSITNDQLYLNLTSSYSFYTIPDNSAPYQYAAGVWISGTGSLTLQTSSVDRVTCTAPNPSGTVPPPQKWCQLLGTVTPTTFLLDVTGSLTIINPSLTLRRNVLGCQVCLANYWCDQMTITACIPHSVSPAGSVSPTQCVCVPGFYGSPGTINPITNQPDTCKPCQKGNYCPGGANQIVCPNGTITLNTGMSSCTICDADWYCALGSRWGCPPNSDSPADSHEVTQCICNPGYYGIAPNCMPCEPGYYCLDNIRTSCGVNGISPPLSSLPSDCYCNPGYSGLDAAPCVPCAQYSYCMHGLVYSCPTNMWSPDYSTTISNCTCDDGFYSVQGACSACSAGSYKPAHGPQTCTSCSVGTYSISAAASSSAVCLSCAPGSYMPTTGQYECTTCPAGTFSSALGSTMCLTCSAGLYSSAGSSVCSACTAGTYSGTSGATSITSCQICPSGAWAMTGSSACTYCGTCSYWHWPPLITINTGAMVTVFSGSTQMHYTFAVSQYDGTMYMTMDTGIHSINPTSGAISTALSIQTPDTRSWWFSSLSASILGNYLYAVQDSIVFRLDMSMKIYDKIYSSNLATCAAEDSTVSPPVLWVVQPTMIRQLDPILAVDLNEFSISGAVYVCVNPQDATYLYVTGSFGLKKMNKATGAFTNVWTSNPYGACQVTPDGNFILLAQTSSVRTVVIYSIFNGGTPINLVGNAPATGMYADGLNLMVGIDAVGIKNFSYNIVDSRTCPPGEFNENGGLASPGTCSVCGEGNLCPGGPNVTSCAAGTYSNATGLREQGQCTKCPEGFFCPGGQCGMLTGQCSVNVESGVCTGPGCDASASEDISIQTCPAGSYSPYAGLKSITDCPLCAAGCYCPDTLTEIPCPNNTWSQSGSNDLSECRCAPGYQCIITKVVHAQIVLQISASTFAQSKALQTQYVDAIATAAGVSPSLVSIQGFFSVSSPPAGRRLLSHRRTKDSRWSAAAVDVHTIIRMQELTELHNLNKHLTERGLPPHRGITLSLHHEVVQTYKH